mgnify:CR=1 FL=1
MNIDIDKTWLAIGLLGQALFSARFIVQWLQSERVKKSVIPSAFWYFSMAGGATLLAYAIHRRDPVFIIGQGTGQRQAENKARQQIDVTLSPQDICP